MKLYVDGQIFQTGALERGMGTLTIELLRAAKRQDPALDITILLNNKLQVTDEHKRRMDDMLDGFNLEHISLETPKTGQESHAKAQLESYIHAHKSVSDETAYLVPALFLFDYFALFPSNCKTVLIFHDLIPLVMWDHLKNVFPGNVYFARFRRVFEADIILANSKNTRQELVRLLGVPEANIVVMGGAPETIRMSKPNALKQIRSLGVDRPYVLLPTGGGHMNHKNNMRAAEALYLLRRDSGRDFVVVATSRYEEHEREAMRRYLGNGIIFTGNISVDDMQSLYCAADVVLTPALAEGLGIPLLNTMSQGVPVAASRIPVYTELSNGENAFYEFNPYDVWEMRDAIFAALARAGFEEKKKVYKKLLDQYTWDNCAVHLLSALRKESQPFPTAAKRLDVIMPDPIASSRQGYIAQSLYAASAKHGFETHYYIDPSIDSPHYDDRGADYVRYVASTYDISMYSPDAGASPVLLFLSRNANFTRLHLLSRIIEKAIIYISDDISEHLYDALVANKIIDPATAKQEKHVQRMLTSKGAFNTPHPLVKARGIIAEERVADKVKETLKTLDMDCPLLVVPDNINKDLNDYVQQKDPVNEKILEFVTEVTASGK